MNFRILSVANRIFGMSFCFISIIFFSCENTIEKRQVNQSVEEFSLDDWLLRVCQRNDTLNRFQYDSLAMKLIDEYAISDKRFDSLQKELKDEIEILPYLKGIVSDLDKDGQDEIICFISKVSAVQSMIIFAKEDGKYSKIYEDYFWLHNEFPSWEFFECRDRSKLFRTGGFHYRGSGFWLYSFKYYRKIECGIKLVAEIPFRANESLNIDLINSNVNLIKDSLLANDNLHLCYNYEFRPSYGFQESLKYKGVDFSVMNYKTELNLDLIWDEDFKEYGGKDLISIDALMNIENDTMQWEIIKLFDDIRANKQLERELKNHLE